MSELKLECTSISKVQFRKRSNSLLTDPIELIVNDFFPTFIAS